MKPSQFDYIFGRDLPDRPDSLFRPPVAVKAIIPGRIIDIGPMAMSAEAKMALDDFSKLADPLHGYLSLDEIDGLRQFLFAWRGQANVVSFLQYLDETEKLDLSFFTETEQRMIMVLAGLKGRLGVNYAKFLDTLSDIKKILVTNPELAEQLEEKLVRFHEGQLTYLSSLLGLLGKEITSDAKAGFEAILNTFGADGTKSINDIVAELLAYAGSLNRPDDGGIQRFVDSLRAAYPKFFRVEKRVFGGTDGNDKKTYKPGEMDVAEVAKGISSATQTAVNFGGQNLQFQPQPPRSFRPADIAELPPVLGAGLMADTFADIGKEATPSAAPKPLRIPISTAVLADYGPTQANNFYLFFAEHYRNLALSTTDRANILSYIFDSADTAGNGSEKVIVERGVSFLTKPGMLYIFKTFFNSDQEKFEPFMHALWLYKDSIVNLDERKKTHLRNKFASALESLYC